MIFKLQTTSSLGFVGLHAVSHGFKDSPGPGAIVGGSKCLRREMIVVLPAAHQPSNTRFVRRTRIFRTVFKFLGADSKASRYGSARVSD